MHQVLVKMFLFFLVSNMSCREVGYPEKNAALDEKELDKTQTQDSKTRTRDTGSEKEIVGTSAPEEKGFDTEVKYDTDLVVKENCKDGWCFIPAATYKMLVPYEEDCRGAGIEPELKITLTNSFIMGATAVTQKQWEDFGFENPSELKCADCPIVNVNWFETLVWLNALSEKEGFDTCYDLSCCEGTIGGKCPKLGSGPSYSEENEKRFKCSCEVYKYDNVYKCPGYRLPTYGESHYAYRAGTTTNTYNGQISNGERLLLMHDVCVESKILDEISWYCANTDRIMPVGLKKPNGFGLYDTIGNPGEWLSDPFNNVEYGAGKEAVVDPHGFLFPGEKTRPDRAVAVANYIIVTACMTSFAVFGSGADFCFPAFGFRAVRTIFNTDEYVKKDQP